MSENITQHDYDNTTAACHTCFETVPVLEMDEYDNCFKCANKYFAVGEIVNYKSINYKIGEIRYHYLNDSIDSQYTVKLPRISKDLLDDMISVELVNLTSTNLNKLIWLDDLE